MDTTTSDVISKLTDPADPWVLWETLLGWLDVHPDPRSILSDYERGWIVSQYRRREGNPVRRDVWTEREIAVLTNIVTQRVHTPEVR